MTDGWFPPRDIFNQGNENLGEVLEGVVSGLVSGSQRKLHTIPKDEDTQAGGDTYLTQDQQNPERERGAWAGWLEEGWILCTGGDLIYMLIDDGGRCRRVHSLSCYSFTPS